MNIDSEELQRALRFSAIFDPEVAERRAKLLFSGARLVHYTSASTAESILRRGHVWMRNVRCMNDFMEVEHGVEMMMRFFRPEDGIFPDVGREAFKKAFDDQWPGLFEEAIDLANNWLPTIRAETYVTCLSVHDRKEDTSGRLSMWRSYGMGPVGVGLVINAAPFYAVEGDLGAYSNPVVYRTSEELFQDFRKMAIKLYEEKDFLSSYTRDEIKNALFQKILNTALCYKHPGFAEEQEWRIMHVRGLWESKFLAHNVEIVGGVPQIIMKIPLGDSSKTGLDGMDIPSLLDRIIVGPTNYPAVVATAFVNILKDIGVPDPEQKVFASEIPLRN